jgi:hypothetical protein
MLWHNDKTFILLVLSLIALFINMPTGFALMGVYLCAVMIRVLEQKIKYLPFFELLGYFLLFDILNLVYFATFFPSKRKVEYVRHQPAVIHQDG